MLEEISKPEKWLESTYNTALRDEEMENMSEKLRDLENDGLIDTQRLRSKEYRK